MSYAFRRLCNKDRDQGPKGICLKGIDHVVTYTAHRINESCGICEYSVYTDLGYVNR